MSDLQKLIDGSINWPKQKEKQPKRRKKFKPVVIMFLNIK